MTSSRPISNSTSKEKKSKDCKRKLGFNMNVNRPNCSDKEEPNKGFKWTCDYKDLDLDLNYFLKYYLLKIQRVR